MRVCIEATALLGPRSGVGHSVAALTEALVGCDPEMTVVLLPLSARRGRKLRSPVPGNERVEVLAKRLPAAVLSKAWTRATWPPAELFCGRVDVFHGPNFLLPPLLHAGGVVTVHDLAFERVPDMCSPKVRTYSRSVPPSVDRASRVIVPSEFTRSELQDWLPESEAKVRVVHPGVRDCFAAPGGRLNPHRAAELGLREPYVVFLGNLELRKNVGVVMDAFRMVAHKRPESQLVLAGSPSTGWEEIAQAHKELLDSSGVVVTGWLPDAEAAALLRGASAFVYPSLYEGFGIPPLEALACGAPVVASDIPPLREGLGSHAVFVNPRSPEDLAGEVAKLLDEPPPARKTEAARRHAGGFTWRRTAEATLDVYREALEERS
ncbi:MAG TPA: glycosyltransferase family 1 protein [Actinomycetota bacterium]|nr:glycosyltransferase family 1 protein [Actinomycetota bacterium]